MNADAAADAVFPDGAASPEAVAALAVAMYVSGVKDAGGAKDLADHARALKESRALACASAVFTVVSAGVSLATAAWVLTHVMGR